MTDEEAFITNILDDVRDEARYNAYADWLLDQGKDAKAEMLLRLYRFPQSTMTATPKYEEYPFRTDFISYLPRYTYQEIVVDLYHTENGSISTQCVFLYNDNFNHPLTSQPTLEFILHRLDCFCDDAESIKKRFPEWQSRTTHFNTKKIKTAFKITQP